MRLLLLLAACRPTPPSLLDPTDTEPAGETGVAVEDTDAEDDGPPAWNPPDPGPTRALLDRDFLPAALDVIGAAEDEIRVAQFLLQRAEGPDQLVAALISAVDRGVSVRVLADETGSDTDEVLARLRRGGVDARLDDPDTTLHAKLFVADDVALVGSHNLTGSALAANHEASLLLSDADAAAWYAGWFDALWDDPEAPTPAAPPDALLDPLADTQVVDALVACADGASARLDAQMYAVAWDDRYPGSEVDRVLGAVEAAHARGVAVRVVLDGSDWIVDNAINAEAEDRLRGAGVPVWRADPDITTHAKVLRCDDTVIVSDANWSYSGLALYRGVSVRADVPDVTTDVAAWMDAVRDAGSAVP